VDQPKTPTTYTVALDGLELDLDAKGEGEARLLLTVVYEVRSHDRGRALRALYRGGGVSGFWPRTSRRPSRLQSEG
jgi:hypothetical protein